MILGAVDHCREREVQTEAGIVAYSFIGGGAGGDKEGKEGIPTVSTG